MISKKDILKMVRRIKRKTEGIPDRSLMHPQREWSIGLVLFLIVAVVGGVYNTQLYLQYLEIEDEVVGEAAFVQSYRQSNADEALKVFGNKKLRFLELREGLAPTSLLPDSGDVASSTEEASVESTEDNADEDATEGEEEDASEAETLIVE